MLLVEGVSFNGSPPIRRVQNLTIRTMTHYVYILMLNDGRLYYGETSDLERRVEQHNECKVKSTAPYQPSRLIYYEAYLNKTDAKIREKVLKSSRGREYIKKQLTQTLNDLHT